MYRSLSHREEGAEAELEQLQRGEGKARTVVAALIKMRRSMTAHLKNENNLTLKPYV